MVSLRQLAQCIGLPNAFSIVHDFYGYVYVPKTLSLITQALLLQGKHVHFNLIRVGIEAFDDEEERKIDRAVQFTRELYATVGLGVGRVTRYSINTVDAMGRDILNGYEEARDLTNEWTVPNDALDVFLVRTFFSQHPGISAINGPCDKNNSECGRMTGSVVDLDHYIGLDYVNTAGIVLAHEVGHYLGLNHYANNQSNLMFPAAPPFVNGMFNDAVYLTPSQGQVMKGHCFVKPGC